MSSSIETSVDLSRSEDPRWRDLGRRAVKASGRDDVPELLEILGLVDEPAPRMVCALGHPLSRHGGCRRTAGCRADTDRLVEAKRSGVR